MSGIHDGPAIDYKELSLDQANDAEFTRLRHSTTSTMKFKLLKSFDNQLIWCDVSTGHNRPYLTAKFRLKVFSNLHGLGHPSHRATKPLINTRFVWHGMNIDIARWCRTCKGCQTAKVSRHNTPVFGKFTEPTERFDHVHVDIVGPLPYADGFRYLLTCVDRFTRWPEAIPMVDIRAETVADAFFSGWIARYGTPATITTDRGAQFDSKLWDSLCNQFGIIRNRTTSYHPQSNGMVLLGVRSAVKERQGRSAAEMIYGTTLRLPGEFTTTGTTIQRKTPSKPRRSTATRTSSRNPQGPHRTGSADTPTSNGTRVKTKKSTAVGRIIQTPARFVQMVHAIVAPNDIYGGPNRIHRINNVFKL